MLHRMKLWNAPFEAIKTGRKWVEMRLYDEKRSKVKEGGMVEFTNMETGETLVCAVVKVCRYPTFEELYAHYDKIAIGYTEEETANPKDMSAYYTESDMQRCGVVAIELKLLKSEENE